MITLVQVILGEDDNNFQFPEPDLSNIILQSFSYAGKLDEDQRLILATKLAGEIKKEKTIGNKQIFSGSEKTVHISDIQFRPLTSLVSSVKVTAAVIRQTKKDLAQAVITITGPLKNVHGIIFLKVGGREYNLNKKTKDPGIWAIHQGEEFINDYQDLFNILANQPDKLLRASYREVDAKM